MSTADELHVRSAGDYDNPPTQHLVAYKLATKDITATRTEAHNLIVLSSISKASQLLTPECDRPLLIATAPPVLCKGREAQSATLLRKPRGCCLASPRTSYQFKMTAWNVRDKELRSVDIASLTRWFTAVPPPGRLLSPRIETHPPVFDI